MNGKHYRRLVIMAVLSFISMYVLMYAMVNTFDEVYSSINQAYMAGLMTAPMVIFEIFVMGSMYRNKRRNAITVAASAVVGIALFMLIRQQTAITDRQFLRSMIPHHSGAILMCKKATIHDAEIKALCRGIVESQRREIDQMKTLLAK